jgi:hypothetical protein
MIMVKGGPVKFLPSPLSVPSSLISFTFHRLEHWQKFGNMTDKKFDLSLQQQVNKKSLPVFQSSYVLKTLKAYGFPASKIYESKTLSYYHSGNITHKIGEHALPGWNV